MALHCTECGFLNAEGANYCQRCGAFIGAPEDAAPESSTATYRIDETGELVPVDLEDVVAQGGGAALVVRAGGGRVGESFPLERDRPGDHQQGEERHAYARPAFRVRRQEAINQIG